MGIIFDGIEGDDNIIPLKLYKICDHSTGNTSNARAHTLDGAVFSITTSNKLLEYYGFGNTLLTQFAKNAIIDGMLKFAFLFKDLKVSYTYSPGYSVNPGLSVGFTSSVDSSGIHSYDDMAQVYSGTGSDQSLTSSKGLTSPLSLLSNDPFKIFFAGSIYTDYPISYNCTVSYTGTMYSGADAYMIPIWGR